MSNFPNIPIYELIKAQQKNIPHIWIPGNVPSLKNSKVIVQVPSRKSACCNADILENRINKTQKELICLNCKKICQRLKYPSLQPSTQVKEYVKETEKYFGITLKDGTFIKDGKFKTLWHFWTKDNPKPMYMGMYFIRAIDNGWDFNNASQIIQDLLQRYGYIDDDSVRNLIPVYLGHHKNKDNPGVILMMFRDPIELLKQSLNHTYDYYKSKQSEYLSPAQ